MELLNNTEESGGEKPTEPGRARLIAGQFNWRMVLIRVLVNALTLIVIAGLLPEIYFADRRLLNVLFLAIMMGILNAFVKPLIQFLTLPFIFATFGFVVVAINTVMLMLLALIFPDRFVVESIIWAIVGGALMGGLASVLESLFGLNLPVMPKPGRADRQQSWLAPQPNPVERLLFGGVAGQEEAELVAEDATVMPPEGSAELEPPPRQSGEIASDDPAMQPGVES